MLSGHVVTVQAGGADKCVDIFKLLDQVFAVTLGETSGDDNFFDLPLFFEFDQLEDCIDRFFAGIFNERTRVNDSDIGVFDVDDAVAVLLEASQDHLGIDEIAGAAQIDHAHFLAVGCLMVLKLFSGADDLAVIFITS